jgi:hypothetical protein
MVHVSDWRYELSKIRQRLVWWGARHIPRSVRYWVVVDTACKVEPNYNPEGVTALQMLKELEA